MKYFVWILFVKLMVLFPFISSAQDELATGQVRANLMGVGVSEPGFFVLGGGVGASARMGKYFSLNGDISCGQRDFPIGGGILERRITHLHLSTDVYPAKAYRGFFAGMYLSYTQVGKEAKNGLSQAILESEPDTYIALGLQIGFSAQINDYLHLLTRASLGVNPDGVGTTATIGVGYTFWPMTVTVME